MTMDEVRDKLRPLIAEMSQAELGRRTGISQSAISRWLAGEPVLSVESVAVLARGLGLELSTQYHLRKTK